MGEADEVDPAALAVGDLSERDRLGGVHDGPIRARRPAAGVREEAHNAGERDRMCALMRVRTKARADSVNMD